MEVIEGLGIIYSSWHLMIIKSEYEISFSNHL